MTIISPAKNQNIFRFFAVLFAVLVIGGVVYIYEYNEVANARFEVKTLKQEIVKLEGEGAELKNELYRATDPEKLQELTRDFDLTVQQKPQYLTLSR